MVIINFVTVLTNNNNSRNTSHTYAFQSTEFRRHVEKKTANYESKRKFASSTMCWTFFRPFWTSSALSDVGRVASDWFFEIGRMSSDCLSTSFPFSTHVCILIRGRVDVSTLSGNRSPRLKLWTNLTFLLEKKKWSFCIHSNILYTWY